MKEIDIGILGAKGFVGSQTSKHLEDFGVGVINADIEEVDITQPQELDEWVKKNPAPVIINFVAYTDVDGAEKEKGGKDDPAVRLNIDAVTRLTQTVKKYDKFLVHISTDMVFPSGVTPGPYGEDVKPEIGKGISGWYAQTKLIGERTIMRAGTRYAIIRISYPFGNPSSEKDFLLKTKKYIENGVPLFTDQQFTPTYILDLANAVLEILRKQREGIFHVATHPVTTPHEFGCYVADRLKIDKEVKKGSIDDFLKQKGRAPRSKTGGLTTRLTEKSLGIKFKSWREAIDDFIPTIGKEPRV